jgi:membrane protein implicated in regulation of membrane protease activity
MKKIEALAVHGSVLTAVAQSLLAIETTWSIGLSVVLGVLLVVLAVRGFDEMKSTDTVGKATPRARDADREPL